MPLASRLPADVPYAAADTTDLAPYRDFRPMGAIASIRRRMEDIVARRWRPGISRVSAIASRPAGCIGRVTLVGAGPGDADLLTLKAVRALATADVVLFDDLVSDDVLGFAAAGARRIDVGKRGRRASCAQGDINSLMVTLALQGHHVVRLKSGDPMIFGRAGEEMDALRADGISVAIVPGVTTAFAAAASLGVSLTHRDHAQSVRFITGHARDGELPATLDWRGLADERTTLVFYMGGRTASAIATKLAANGLSPATPVVVMAAVTRTAETRWHGTLADLSRGDGQFDASEPVLLGIGQVFQQSTPGALGTALAPAVADAAGRQ